MLITDRSLAASIAKPSAKDALETYKQKDTSKGTSPVLYFIHTLAPLRRAHPSRRALQVDRLGADHEEQRVQDHGRQQVSGGHRVLERAVGAQGGRAAGEFWLRRVSQPLLAA